MSEAPVLEPHWIAHGMKLVINRHHSDSDEAKKINLKPWEEFIFTVDGEPTQCDRLVITVDGGGSMQGEAWLSVHPATGELDPQIDLSACDFKVLTRIIDIEANDIPASRLLAGITQGAVGAS